MKNTAVAQAKHIEINALARYSALAASAAVPTANATVIAGSVNETVGIGGESTEAPSGKTSLEADITDELALNTLATLKFNSSTANVAHRLACCHPNNRVGKQKAG